MTPRAAARIQELKGSGVEISSEREGKYVRYRLVGVGADAGPRSPGTARVSSHSGQATQLALAPLSAYERMKDAA
jgi:hypothetical protein